MVMAGALTFPLPDVKNRLLPALSQGRIFVSGMMDL
jgi:hypothetical protein